MLILDPIYKTPDNMKDIDAAVYKEVFQPKSMIFFLFLNENLHVCCWCLLEVPCYGASNEYPPHLFHAEI